MIAETTTPPAPVTRARRVSRFAALAGAAALITGMLAGCGAGQISETASQHPTVGGSNADVGKIALRNMQIEAPTGGSWAQGSSVALTMTIVNNSGAAEQLIGITTDAAAKVLIFPDSGRYLDYLATLAPPTTPSTTPAPTPSPATSIAVTPTGSVTVPSSAAVQFGYGAIDRPVILISGLTAPIGGGSAAKLTFTFANAGTVSADVPVSLTQNGAKDSTTLNLPHEGGTGEKS